MTDRPRHYGRTPATAPGPTGADMLRGIRTISADPLAFLAEQWHRHGDVVQFPIPTPPTYLVCHPDDVRTVLVGAARVTSKDTIQYRALSKVTGAGLLTSDGATWREHRRIVQPAFHPTTLPAVAGQTSAAAARLVTRIRAAGDQTLVDVDTEIMALALEVVGESLFGHELGPVAQRVGRATLDALEEVVATARRPVRAPALVPTRGNLRMRRALRELDAAVGAILAQRSRQGPPGTPDLLAHLLSSGLPERAVRDEIVTFLVAGHETVASALTWSLVLLGSHPDVADAVAAEAGRVLGPAATPTLAGSSATADPEVAGGDRSPPDVAALGLARAVVDEALRLHPPAWLVTRRTDADLTFSGHAVPAGSLVILCPWITHRHPVAWEQPEQFRPDRFLPGGSAPRHAFLPFGAGPRMCIGRDFAYAEAVVALALICRSVTLEPSGAPPRALPLVTIRPDRPVWMRVRAR